MILNYADDIKLYYNIDSTNQLQDCLTDLHNWLMKNISAAKNNAKQSDANNYWLTITTKLDDTSKSINYKLLMIFRKIWFATYHTT